MPEPSSAPHPPKATKPRALPFTGPWLLAPMEGVTDPLFRSLVLARHEPHELGGTFTEFVRVVDRPLPRAVLDRHLGDEVSPIPVGLQLMGRSLAAVAATAARVTNTSAALVDINFGCPAKGALRGCAGSALLKDPRAVEEVVRVCVDAVAGQLPVSAKIRAGFDDDSLLEELAQAAQAGGAQLLTVHCRTRAEGYQDEVDWSRIARAVQAVSIPVCGNGGVLEHRDLEAMRQASGCAYVMVGRASLGNPWIFSGREVSLATALDFLLEYIERMLAGGAPAWGAMARTKQLLKTWTAGGWLLDPQERRSWMSLKEPERMFTGLRTLRSQCPSEDPRA